MWKDGGLQPERTALRGSDISGLLTLWVESFKTAKRDALDTHNNWVTRCAGMAWLFLYAHQHLQMMSGIIELPNEMQVNEHIDETYDMFMMNFPGVLGSTGFHERMSDELRKASESRPPDRKDRIDDILMIYAVFGEETDEGYRKQGQARIFFEGKDYRDRRK